MISGNSRGLADSDLGRFSNTIALAKNVTLFSELRPAIITK
jgi:hypothetical protein